ncbi:hypothetical protein M218_07785 [Burkholderia pseudomallei MSHR338]|nr:hypothetical protein M218_07785 [Burkholderia pseudomallei MSHR338]EXJ02130.1 hypothetical protein T210_0111900 [Burkholderia pseudomallei MSHR6137]KAA8763441.1 hypothetical protein F5D26_30970 [Burkholderia pseudomallei]OMW28688.1 hypothetical protein AQ807_19180 [Burkholderia pseudomallei]OMZ29195.1 hypothetical protein AQ861_22400 [Burkholderia pseudomallei]
MAREDARRRSRVSRRPGSKHGAAPQRPRVGERPLRRAFARRVAGSEPYPPHSAHIRLTFGTQPEHGSNTFGERSSRAATGAHFVKARTSVRRALCNNRFISAC